ncbi:MAG: hypothetical protein V1913_12780 [Fibrobacterota bacterium]
MNLSLYGQIALAQAPRVLGLCDRDAASATYGCFDRHYWHYKLLDLANVRYQEAALFLALLYKGDHAPWRLDPKVREWSLAAVRFWGGLQQRNGSFDEVYPFENSFCATAFSTWAVTEALLALNAPGDSRVLERAGEWLLRHDNPDVANQRAAAVLALQNLVHLTGRDTFRAGAESKTALLLASQDSSGYFPEYGGGDAGYQSLTLACMARYMRKAGRDDLTAALQNGAAYVAHRIDSLGRFVQNTGSRRTQFLFPSGFALLGRNDVIEKHGCGVESGQTLQPGWMDDRYCIGLATDYLLASREGTV